MTMPEAAPSIRPRVRVGALGWDHPAWWDIWYPADLPAEWRLAFYANAFEAVLVPWAQWSRQTRATFEDWAEATPTGFRFGLATPASAAADPATQTTAREASMALGDRLIGWVLPAAEASASGGSAGGSNPLPLQSPWTEAGGPVAGSLGCLPIDSEERPAKDLRPLRTRIERFAAETQGSERFLFLTGDPPSSHRLREARTLVELMGY
jgi:hypothetical protein